ncbi:MAG: cell division protein ZapA [Mariprofundales bacterium]|nr:cell division protein ZapA [Mariprofundales bacterium]
MNQVVEIKLLDRTHRIVHEDPAMVQDCAALVHDKVDELRRAGAVVGGERLLLLVALNIAEDLLRLQRQQADGTLGLTSAIDALASQAEALANAPLR